MSGTTATADFVYASTDNGSSWTQQSILPAASSGSYGPAHLAIGLASKGLSNNVNLEGWMVGGVIADFFKLYTLGVDTQPAGVISQDVLKNFPNPFTGKTLVRATLDGGRKAAGLIIFNAIGQAVADLSDDVTHGDRTQVAAVFDATNLPEGIYYAVLRLNDGSVLSTPLSVVRP